MGLNFPKDPTSGQVFTHGGTTFKWNGASWEGTPSTPTKSANPSFDGSLNIQPSSEHDGIRLDGGYTWIDLIGDVTPKVQGNSAVTYDVYRTSVYGWAHPLNAGGDLSYHVPHEYAKGTNVYLHPHWGHNGTNISGSLVITYNISLARRTTGVSTFSEPITIVQTLSSLNLTNSPRYCHRVDEIQISNAGGTGGLLNSNDITVDSLILVHYTISTIPSITGGVKNLPYLLTVDMHMQSNLIGTKNKDPNFYA